MYIDTHNECTHTNVMCKISLKCVFSFIISGCGASDHALSIQSFSNLQRCHMCQKFLWGIYHQGYSCPRMYKLYDRKLMISKDT